MRYLIFIAVRVNLTYSILSQTKISKSRVLFARAFNAQLTLSDYLLVNGVNAIILVMQSIAKIGLFTNNF